jgi:hypothetical protein
MNDPPSDLHPIIINRPETFLKRGLKRFFLGKAKNWGSFLEIPFRIEGIGQTEPPAGEFAAKKRSRS